jgi:hypothetical protein
MEEAMLALLAIVLAHLPPLGGDLPPLPAGRAIEGAITADDEVISTEILAKRYDFAPTVAQAYSVEVETSGRHVIDMWGYGFDAYLVLRDAEGRVVAEDDDGMGGTDARIVVGLDAQQRYRLEAAALHGGRGEFELELSRGEPDVRRRLEWREKEIQRRVRAVFVEEAWKKVEVVESKHYVVLTDSGAGKKFGKILDEDIYKGFFEYYGLDMPKEHRPMFVYLFNTREAYIGFLVRHLRYSKDAAEKTGGIFIGEAYATSYTSPRDPVHFHECAHQIMGTLLDLNGGGSWFQEGVAECYEDQIKRFNREAETRMLITTKQALPLPELFAARSMLYSAGENVKGGGGAGGMYGQAASVILYLKEGPHRKRFHDLLFALGRSTRSDLEATGRVLQETCGISIDELDREWYEHYE